MRTRLVVVLFTAVAAALAPALGAPAAAGEDAPAIRLRAATFRPALGETPDLPPGLTIAGYAAGEDGYYLIQFSGPVATGWADTVRAAGGEVLAYIPDFAFKVRMTPEEADAVAALPSVGWVGLFHPAYKFSPTIAAGPAGLYRVVIEAGADPGRAATALESAGVKLLLSAGRTVLVAAPEGRVAAMARVADVAWIEPYSFAVKHNEQGGGVIIGGATAHGRGFDGSTQIVAVADTGLGDGTASGAHPDIPASRIVAIHDWPGASGAGCYDAVSDGAQDVDSGHGTHTSVSAVGDGGAGGIGTGTAPGARLVFQAVEDFADMKGQCAFIYPDAYYLLGLPLDLTDLYQEAFDDGARIHSNSWGTANTYGEYTDDTAATDAFVFDHPTFVVTYSVGNDGIDTAPADGVVDPTSVTSPATAKNVIAVGASEGARPDSFPCDTSLTYTSSDAYQAGLTCSDQAGTNTLGTAGSRWGFTVSPLSLDVTAGNDEQMAPFSSRGPTNDGRIRPDVVAPGTWILSGYSSEYQEGYGGVVNPVNGLYQWDGWGMPYDTDYKYMGGTSMSNPLVAGAAAVVADFYKKTDTHTASAALVKATLVNTARDLLDENNDGADDNDFPIPNIHEGWGLVDLDNATDGTHQYVDHTAGLSTAGSATFEFEVLSNAMPLRITVAWSDYPASTSASADLVNDLDLVVTAPNGITTYVGNDFSSGWSQPSTAYDRVNNLENVYIANPTVGTWTVTVTGYNVPMGPQPFALVADGDLATQVIDTDPPVFSDVPTDITEEATGSDGDTVNYTPPTATDAIDGPVAVTCAPASGTTFALGTTTVECSATDAHGNTATASFDVTVQDTTNPSLVDMPTNTTAEATGPSGATINYTPPTATDLVDTNVDVECTPASGATFALGTTTVTCTATDDSANTDSDTFDITIQDTTPPTFSNVPANITTEATSESGATVNYTPPTANDIVDGSVAVTCIPPSGSTFGVGTTQVECSATDTNSNTATATFDVTVTPMGGDNDPPVISDVPNDITEEATSGAGAVVGYATPTANDAVEGSVPVDCLPASGSTFALGTTTVTCEASDTSGNAATVTFDVTIEDTTPPEFPNVPDDITEEATDGSGAAVSYSDPGASDVVDGVVSVTCAPPSGALFALGTTTVTCSATDAHSNTATATFDVTVEDTTPPDFSDVPGPITQEATSGAGAAVNYTAPTASDLVSGSVGVACTPISGSTFSLGTTSVTCTATDAAANEGTATFDVTVEDTSPPTISNVPGPVNAVATTTNGATVAYALPTGSDLVDGPVAVVCSPSSGSFFAVTTTTVTCSATDAAANEGTATFDVTVVPPTCRGRTATIWGTPGADTLIGTSGPDVIVGFGGADTIKGRGGRDIVCGGPGADQIWGGGSRDLIWGQGGADIIYGGKGNDKLIGNGGNDTLYGQAGEKDRLIGSGGSDTLDGGPGGSDRCSGEIEIACEL